MTLKEELEILRGEPIEVFTGDPMDIPCIETSNPDKLCKHPVVSVCMITYNHEPYIRQAIEGVMMQKTDFEFELVIGEDASTDRTREICFEYQKRYPDKIRVLWWHENLRKVNHPGGGNGARTRAHCRGEFIAFCEGDDYWIDPLKLQKQVDIMRRHPNVGLCFSQKRIIDSDSGREISWGESEFNEGVIPGRSATLRICTGYDETGTRLKPFEIFTATTLYRKDVCKNAHSCFEIYKWNLFIGDTTLWLGISAVADFYAMCDVVAVYRRHAGGISSLRQYEVLTDGWVVRAYFAKKQLNLSVEKTLCCHADSFRQNVLAYALRLTRNRQVTFSHKVFSCSFKKRLFQGIYWCVVRSLMERGWLRTWNYRLWFRCTHLISLSVNKLKSWRRG